jgi:hypothetical protein
MAELMTFGVDAFTDRVILDPLEEAVAAARIAAQDGDPAWTTRAVAPTFGGLESADPYDPREVGWVVVVGRDDPARSAIVAALADLARRRVGDDADWGPIDFDRSVPEERWLLDELLSRDPVPRYVVLAGSPTYLPFSLQATLATNWLVGRLDFSTVSGGVESQDVARLTAYASRMCEDGPAPSASMVAWATTGSRRDPTFYSRHLLAERLVAGVEKKGKVGVTRLFDGDATGERLLDHLLSNRPLLVFTASHGAAAPMEKGVDEQASVNGALVGGDRTRFGAADLPGPDTAFVEGGVVFQFACFGYGTPAVSGYTHWDQQVKKYEAPFELVSALPKAALAHPRGPIGYVAHADYALLHAFADTGRLGFEPPKRLAGRIGGFRSVVNEILLRRPVGAALSPMAGQLGLVNHDLAERWDRARREGVDKDSAVDLVDRFVRRNDARFYFLLGDPAARPAPIARAKSGRKGGTP